MIFVGVIANRLKILDEKTNSKLSSLLLNITLPLFIISSFDFKYSLSTLKNMLLILLFGFLFHIFCFVIGLFIYHKYPQEVKGILIFAILFTNCGYVGFPILEKFYGSIGIILGALFLIPFNVFLWTVGVLLFNNQKFKLKNIFLNPGIIASIIGTIIFSFSIKLPIFIDSSFSTIGNMTTPLSMIIIGGVISQMKLKEIFINKYIYFNSFLRLIIVPLVVFLIMRLFKIDSVVFGVCVILSGMPAAVTTPIFAQRYHGDVNLATKLVFMSTLLAVLTIPLLIAFLNI